MLATQALGGVPVPLYQDSIEKEMEYIVDHAEVRFAVVEDQEQVDKLLQVKARCPRLEYIVYDDARGLRHYKDEGLISLAAVQELGRRFDGEHRGYFEQAVAKGSADDVAIICYTSGTTGQPKGTMLSHRNLIVTGRNAVQYEGLRATDEIVAYLPMAWIGDHMFSFAQSILTGFTTNCPESSATVLHDLREIGPTYFFAPPGIYQRILTTAMIRIEDAAWPKRRLVRFFLDVARRVERCRLTGKPVSPGDRLLHALGRVLVYGPLRDNLGMSRVRLAYTAGEAIGPELFEFYRALGVNMKQLYGMTESSALICIQRDGEVRLDTVGTPLTGVEIRIGESGEVLYRSPGVFQGYYKNPEATRQTLEDGWVHSGDAGIIDRDGHLRIIDRARDVGRLADGTLFAPKYLENKLKFSPYVREAVCIGPDRPYVVRAHQHRPDRGRKLGRAARAGLHELHRSLPEARGLRAHPAGDPSGQPEPAGGAAAPRRPDPPVPHAPQGARSGRPGDHADAQGATGIHRPEVRGAGGGALLGARSRLGGGEGHLRGRADRYRARRRADPGGRGVRRRGDRVSAPTVPGTTRLSRERGASATDPLTAAAEGKPLLEVDGISVRFGAVQALSRVSLDVRRGEILAIIGPNGAGKTTLINVISGFYHPYEGRILFEGRDRTRLSAPDVAALGFARTFQNVALFRGMTVLDNIMTGRLLRMRGSFLWEALYWGPARRQELEHRAFVERIIDFLEIQAIRKTPAGRLPYGLQKRVELARALAAEPTLLLLDEPMAGMNVEEKEDMCRFILDVNDEFGTTIALIEHDMSVVMDISDRVAVLDYGRKIAEGPPEAVRADPAVIAAYLGVARE